MRRLILTLAFCAAAPAAATDLVVQVQGPGGAPVANAVVTLYPGGRPATLAGERMSFQIAQRDLQFQPFVIAVPVGADVSFPNFDNVRHHVYSFSPVRRFELRLFAREQSRSVHFDRVGIVPIGCNIHDGMIAYVDVVDTGFAAVTDRAGRAAFTGVAAGGLTARVWHPWLRAPGNQTEMRWTLPGSGRIAQTVSVALRPPPRTPTY
ncbi:MAG TPA: methylamine utilization protein [Allosphingosinicella sp.]|jgi:plastocyanin